MSIHASRSRIEQPFSASKMNKLDLDERQRTLTCFACPSSLRLIDGRGRTPSPYRIKPMIPISSEVDDDLADLSPSTKGTSRLIGI